MVDLREDIFLQSGGRPFTAVRWTPRAEAWTQRVRSCLNRKWRLLGCTLQRQQQPV